ncbi:hypothetical protein FB566_0308 [Stackebrandtia endophytica]|uniref:Uncharacterized protein n=1 Tax=Stackebrandtia endophytica TaxID=1496996 RepID=A0A543AQF9_9ACTN|nr:hypothetical protein [Stackebrandtia endophytica]TQL74820.1 hypothetical protein FB566_0308 [Stackebrandtia endophytica]
MSGEFSTVSRKALVGLARKRLRDADELDRIRVAVASARVPDWAFGGGEAATRWRDVVDTAHRRCDEELARLRDALRRRGSAALVELEAADVGSGGGPQDASPTRPIDPSAMNTVMANPKATLVDRDVELPGWREATYRYTDVDGCGFDVPAPGLPPVRVGVVTAAEFHDFRVGTESDDGLECTLARHGHQLEEAELVGRAMGSRLRVLGEHVIPLWLSSPEMIGVAAERVLDAIGALDAVCPNGSRDTSTMQNGGTAVRLLDDHPDEDARLRWRLSDLVDRLELAGADLKQARDRCAVIVVEYQGAIIAAKERMLRESTDNADDDSADSTLALLSAYESAVLAMNDAIATTVVSVMSAPPLAETVDSRIDRNRRKMV